MISTEEETTTVYIVDDDSSVRRGLSRLVRMHGRNVIDFPSADEFLAHATLVGTCCMVLDVHMPGIDGLRLQRILKDNHIGIPVIFLTGRTEIPSVVSAIKSGAVDFLTKPVDEDQLLEAIGRAEVQDREQRKINQERASIQSRVDSLTEREREVFTFVISGLMNKQIADHMGTAEKTVKVHRGRMVRKMAVDSVAELVRMADKVGVEPAVSSQTV